MRAAPGLAAAAGRERPIPAPLHEGTPGEGRARGTAAPVLSWCVGGTGDGDRDRGWGRGLRQSLGTGTGDSPLPHTRCSVVLSHANRTAARRPGFLGQVPLCCAEAAWCWRRSVRPSCRQTAGRGVWSRAVVQGTTACYLCLFKQTLQQAVIHRLQKRRSWKCMQIE